MEDQDLDIFSNFIALVKLHRSKRAENERAEVARSPTGSDTSSENWPQQNISDLLYEDNITNPDISNHNSVKSQPLEQETDEQSMSSASHDNAECDRENPLNIVKLPTRAERQKELMSKNEAQKNLLQRRELAKTEVLKKQLEFIKFKKAQMEAKSLALIKKRAGKKVKIRRWAANPDNLDRYQNGYHAQIFKKLKNGPEEEFIKHTRMSKNAYKLLAKHVHMSLHKLRQRISLDERLSLTLFHLAHGESLTSLAIKYKMGKATARKTVLDTCESFWKILSPLYLTEQTAHEYQETARDFEMKWNMPNCVGALGGKHIKVKPMRKGGPTSLVLLAACDAKYMFTAVNVHSHGSVNDVGFKESDFGRKLLEGNLPLPVDIPLPNTEIPIQHYYISDAAFPLLKHIMRPYPDDELDSAKQVFNYRLNRARRTIENSFGVLSARWQILLTSLDFLPENCETIILACVALHNFIVWNDMDNGYCSENYADGNGLENNVGWRKDIAQCGSALESIKTTYCDSSEDGIEVRNSLSNYFSNVFILDDINTFDAEELQLYMN